MRMVPTTLNWEEEEHKREETAYQQNLSGKQKDGRGRKENKNQYILMGGGKGGGVVVINESRLLFLSAKRLLVRFKSRPIQRIIIGFLLFSIRDGRAGTKTINT